MSATAITRLLPGSFTLRKDPASVLVCTLADGTTHAGVSAVLLFPISHPRKLVSLRYIDSTDKEQEIGIVEDLASLSEQEQSLVEESLVRQYHEQVIQRVLQVKHQFGQLFFKVVTQRGVEDFVMPWRQDRAEDWGENGKVLLDSLNNRYLIPDIDTLSNAEKRAFKTYVYW
jgi:hypothetical protein